MTNILEIIKKAPENTKYYSTIVGECKVTIVLDSLLINSPIHNVSANKYGEFAKGTGICTLFPIGMTWEEFENKIDCKTLNLVEILKDCPKGTELYSVVNGKVTFVKIDTNETYPIIFKNAKDRLCSASANGSYLGDVGECILFPSKENRDWNTFKNTTSENDERRE